MPYHEPVIVERRELGSQVLLTIHAPELARAAKPGQVVLIRCAPVGADDPLLRRPLYISGADGAAGVVDLLVAPDERGLAWLAAQPSGARLDLYGPAGAGFTSDPRAGNLLLAGAGPALPALVFLARAAAGRAAVVLLAAGEPGRLPPPYLQPPAVEYQTSGGGEAGLLDLLSGSPDLPGARSPITWADQVFLALSEPLVAGAAAAVRAGRLRWERDFAQVALAGAMPCGLGTCMACPVTTRSGTRLRCKDGPVFDLRTL